MTGPPLSTSMDFIGERAGRDGRRPRFGHRPVRLRVVGADPPRRRVAVDALAPARERRLARPQHRRSARRAARRRLRVPARRGSAGEQGAAACSAWSSWTIDRFVVAPDAPARAAVRRHAPSRAPGRLEHADRDGGERPRVLGARAAPRPAAGSALGEVVVVRAVRRRHVDDRVRRAELGARWSRGAGRRRAASRAGDGAGGRAAVGLTARGGIAGARDSFSRTSASPIPAARRCSISFDLTIPAGSSLAIVGQNGAGKTTLAKLLCRLYDPQSGAIESTASTCARSTSRRGGRVSTAVFQDFIRFELPLRDNVAPAGAPDDDRASPRSSRAGAANLAGLDTVLARGYDGRHGSVGRPMAARGAGARVVRRADGRGRRAAGRTHGATRCPRRSGDLRAAAAATRHCTTILISHRFSTVRHADRICVLEHGRVSSSARTTS